MISYKGKFIFIPVRRAAGRSINNALSNYCSKVLNEDIKNDIFNRGVLSEGGKFGNWYGDINKYKDYHVFTIVRNPWDRLISGYFYSGMGSKFLGRKVSDLEEFLNNLPTQESNYRWWFHIRRTLTEMLVDKNGKYIADFTIRFENIQKDFELLCEKLNIENLNLPIVGKIDHKKYLHYYNDRTYQMVANMFKDDIKYFGY